MKQIGQVNPKAVALLRDFHKKLEKVQAEKDGELEEFVEDHCELKFAMNSKINKKFKVKIDLCKDPEKVAELKQQFEQQKQKSEKELN